VSLRKLKNRNAQSRSSPLPRSNDETRTHRVGEKNGGIGSGYPDEEYKEAGAEIVDWPKMFRAGRYDRQSEGAASGGISAFCAKDKFFSPIFISPQQSAHRRAPEVRRDRNAYETIQNRQPLPLLEPMSEIGRRMSVVMGAYIFWQKHNLVAAAFCSVGFRESARASCCDWRRHCRCQRRSHGHRSRSGRDDFRSRSRAKMRFLDITMGSAHYALFERIAFCASSCECRSSHRRGSASGSEGAKIDYARDVESDENGQRAVNIAIDQGGCAETIATDHAFAAYLCRRGVTHYCVANKCRRRMRAPHSALTNITYRYVDYLPISD